MHGRRNFSCGNKIKNRTMVGVFADRQPDFLCKKVLAFYKMRRAETLSAIKAIGCGGYAK